jgi:hypothetical protein
MWSDRRRLTDRRSGARLYRIAVGGHRRQCAGASTAGRANSRGEPPDSPLNQVLKTLSFH